ncbi:MAG: carbohydrate binding family 9 domain-containing protein [Planctomycetes bacterium]|nr:carbohydrate binding family 9 domain-containing protein [Planctomycetota bacterium]
MLLLSFAWQGESAPRAGSRPSAHAERIAPADAPVIDGRLEDAVWSRIAPISDLRQKEPLQDADPTERTIIKIAQDGKNIYFAFECYDSEPERIRATQRRRDADVDPDDRIVILLDTLHDHRNAYFLAVGAGGAIQDALVGQNGRVINGSWDGIWDARVNITNTGWTAEVAIPVRTLATDRLATVWGMNIERVIRRKRETCVWATPEQDINFTRVSEAGDLAGMDHLDHGVGVDVVPYAKATVDRRYRPPDTDLLGTAGGELFYRLTPGVTGALTINTDFAETEVDDRRVNLTRFPLFFPEKRKFFLEDAGVFAFDAGGGATSGGLLPFFSRRIGLDDAGNRIPLAAGLKVSGYAGDWSGGVLGVDAGANSNISERELFAARVRNNLDEHNTIGGIITNGNPTGGFSNQLIGADYRYSTSDLAGHKNLDVTAFFLKTFTENTNGNDRAVGFELSYPNDLWSWSFGGKEIGDEFNPALGFVARTGIRQYDGFISYNPRPGGDVRKVRMSIAPSVITNMSGEVETASMLARLGVEMDAGDELRFKVIPQFDRVAAPFDIVPNLTIPADSYSQIRYRIELESAGRRPWLGILGVEWGDFYEGERTDVEASLQLRPSGVFNMSAESSTSYLRLPGGDKDVQVGRVRGEINFSTRLSWQSVFQFDNISKGAGINSRVRLILEPGRDMFFVLNHNWEETSTSRAVVPESTDFVVKIVFSIRF